MHHLDAVAQVRSTEVCRTARKRQHGRVGEAPGQVLRLDSAPCISAGMCNASHQRPANPAIRADTGKERVEFFARCPARGFPQPQKLLDFWVCCALHLIREGLVYGIAGEAAQRPALCCCPFPERGG